MDTLAHKVGALAPVFKPTNTNALIQLVAKVPIGIIPIAVQGSKQKGYTAGKPICPLTLSFPFPSGCAKLLIYWARINIFALCFLVQVGKPVSKPIHSMQAKKQWQEVLSFLRSLCQSAL